ncbi:NUDIX domain-containing protein [Candidatus Dependentiae bacterium]|jgi:8-oxo-dGTP diphosphatase|nr:NUDIX domain-containing protein [Candidatus Dependentiae bacterium]
MNKPTARVGIGVFVFKEGQFLMGVRKNTHGSDHWSIPGGHLEFGETFEQTAQREVFEETGLMIKNIRFGAVTNDFFVEQSKHYVSVWLLSDWMSGSPEVREPDKYTNFIWCNFENLPSPLFYPWKQLKESPFIKTIKKELNKNRISSTPIMLKSMDKKQVNKQV